MTKTQVVPLLLASLLLLGATPDEQPVKDWPLFRAPDGSFSIRLPGAPEISGPPSDATYLVRFGDTVTYYVKTTKLPEVFKSVPWEIIAEAFRETAVESFGEYGPSRLINSESCTFSGHSCITFKAEANPKGFPRTWMVAKLIYLGDHTIAIIHSAPAEGFNQPRVDEYLATFQLLEGEAKKGSEPASPTWLRAFLMDGEVCFEPPQAINWEKAAEQSFRRFPLQSPDRDALAAQWNEVTRSSMFQYSAPLPDGLSGSDYTLLAEAGLQTIHPRHLRGEVLYKLDRPDAAPKAPMLSGYVCGVADAPVSDAGFVTKRSLQRGEPYNSPVPPAEDEPSAVKAAFTVVDGANGDTFLFVRRASDAACSGLCCEYSYDLFSMKPELTRVLANAYSCDL